MELWHWAWFGTRYKKLLSVTSYRCIGYTIYTDLFTLKEENFKSKIPHQVWIQGDGKMSSEFMHILQKLNWRMNSFIGYDVKYVLDRKTGEVRCNISEVAKEILN